MSQVLLTDDQCFLLHFIMGTYFGPDLEQERPHKSAFQRRAEGLPQYHVKDLTVSQMQTTVMESVYYYILRKADGSVVLKRDLLLQYIHGSLPIMMWRSTYPQFNDLYPSQFHWHSQYENEHDAIGNMVFLNNPATDFIEPGDIERFKKLTGLDDFLLDRGSAIRCTFRKVHENPLHDVPVQHVDTSDDENELPSAMPCSSFPCNADPIADISTQTSQMNVTSWDDLVHGTLFLPSSPSKEDWSNLAGSIKSGFAMTGSAASRPAGPILGLVDIGESEDSYFFRVALPGVEQDERDFSCEVDGDGRVIIRGVTVTGESTVWKCSQSFEMQSQNLCPPGNFSISFSLPGQVDPQRFRSTFAAGGILEGIAFKVGRHAT